MHPITTGKFTDQLENQSSWKTDPIGTVEYKIKISGKEIWKKTDPVVVPFVIFQSSWEYKIRNIQSSW
jgi:hypothetical protein